MRGAVHVQITTIGLVAKNGPERQLRDGTSATPMRKSYFFNAPTRT
jgi:hypothetical protein